MMSVICLCLCGHGVSDMSLSVCAVMMSVICLCVCVVMELVICFCVVSGLSVWSWHQWSVSVYMCGHGVSGLSICVVMVSVVCQCGHGIGGLSV